MHEKPRKDSKKEYCTPQFRVLGSVTELTQGGDPQALGDGVAFRGPFSEPDPTPVS